MKLSEKTERCVKQQLDRIKKAEQNIKLWEERKAEALLRKQEAEDKLLRFQSSPPKLKVSDHAFVRYLERKCEYDIKSLKEQMLSSELINKIGDKTDGIFRVDGIEYRVEDRVIVTII